MKSWSTLVKRPLASWFRAHHPDQILSLSMLEEGSWCFYAIHDSLYFLSSFLKVEICSDISMSQEDFVYLHWIDLISLQLHLWKISPFFPAQDLLVVTDELDSWVAGDERLLDVLVHCCSYVAGVCFANTWSPGLAASYMISLRPHHFSRICALLLHRSIVLLCAFCLLLC